MDYVQEKNELWKQILEQRTKELTLEIPSELISYLKSWNFTSFHFEDVFDEDLSGENTDGIHSGIRYWDVETNGEVIQFSKKENYEYGDVPDEWKYNLESDFEEYLKNRFNIDVDELIWTFNTIDELIFTI